MSHPASCFGFSQISSFPAGTEFLFIVHYFKIRAILAAEYLQRVWEEVSKSESLLVEDNDDWGLHSSNAKRQKGSHLVSDHYNLCILIQSEHHCTSRQWYLIRSKNLWHNTLHNHPVITAWWWYHRFSHAAPKVNMQILPQWTKALCTKGSSHANC